MKTDILRLGNPRRGFSLIELVAAMAVLLILALLIFQITNAASNTANISNRAIDATSQARVAFDRMAMDLNGIVRRSDTDFRVKEGSNLLDFLSAVTGPDLKSPPANFKNRGSSRIVYRVENRPENRDRPCLIRAAKTLSWNEPGFFGLKPDGFPVRSGDVGYPPSLEVATEDFDILAGGVFAMAIGFQLYPDDQEVFLPGETTSSITQARGQIVYRPPMRGKAGGPPPSWNEYVDANRISSLVVAVAVLDLNSLEVLNDEQTELLSSAFTPNPPQGQMPVAKWMEDTKNLTVLPDIPLRASQSVRVYQRTFPINSFGNSTP